MFLSVDLSSCGFSTSLGCKSPGCVRSKAKYSVTSHSDYTDSAWFSWSSHVVIVSDPLTELADSKEVMFHFISLLTAV